MTIDTKALRQARRRAGLSQRSLAEKAGISHSHMNYIERGDKNPSESITKKLADALSLSVDELFSDD